MSSRRSKLSSIPKHVFQYVKSTFLNADHDEMDDDTPGISSSWEGSRQQEQAAATTVIKFRSGTALDFNTPRVSGATDLQPQLERLQIIVTERSIAKDLLP